MKNKTGSTNTGRDSKSMWNPSPTTYLTAIISETWGKTDDPLIISWQRPSSWFKTVAICPSSMMNYCEMLSTLCERNLLLKEMTSHSRNPEKLLALTKLPGYSSKHYTEPKTTPKPNREARETTKPSSLKLPCWGPWRKKTLRSDWSLHLFVGFSYCEAMITFNENFSKHWEI